MRGSLCLNLSDIGRGAAARKPSSTHSGDETPSKHLPSARLILTLMSAISKEASHLKESRHRGRFECFLIGFPNNYFICFDRDRLAIQVLDGFLHHCKVQLRNGMARHQSYPRISSERMVKPDRARDSNEFSPTIARQSQRQKGKKNIYIYIYS